jgi:hypothetical protein
MKRGPNKVRALILATCVAMVPQVGQSVFAQSGTDTTTTVHKKARKSTSIQQQMDQMQQQFQQQQEEINQLRQQLLSRDQQLQQAKDTAQQAQQAAQQAQSQLQSQQNNTQTTEAYTNLHQAVQNAQAQAEQAQQTAAMAEQDQKALQKKITHPDDIYYKGITISPKGSFLAAETDWRSGATGGGLNTAFTSVPLENSPAGQMSEFDGSGRQSRIAIKATGKLPDWTMTGYYEMDWLGTGITSNNNQSNSYVVRMRQLWADAKLDNGWDFSGGMGWSLAAETTQGESRGTEILPGTIDPQYTAGFVWTRQYSFRVVKQIRDKMWLGASAENPETLNPGGSNLPTNILIGSGGTGGGLYNSTANYSFNLAPDMIAKLVAEPKPGEHFELFGIASFYRDRIYPIAVSPGPSTAPYNSTVVGGGGGASGRVTVHKMFVVGLKGLYGEGVGRYGNAQLGDVTIRPDGTLSPIHGFSALSTVELNPNKRLNIYLNYGGDYLGRDYATSGGKQVGYGVYTADMSGCGIEPASTAAFPSSDPSTPGNSTNGCKNNNKDVQEFTAGYWFFIHNSEKGALKQGIQYSRIRRDLWSGQGGDLNPGGGAHGTDNMVFTSFRYYLP